MWNPFKSGSLSLDDAVLAKLRSSDVRVRQRTIDTLVKNADSRLLNQMDSIVVHEHDQPITEAIAEILARVGTPEARTILDNRVSFALKFRIKDAALRREAIHELAQDTSASQMQRLYDLLSRYEDSPVYKGVAETLGEMKTPDSIAMLVKISLYAYWEDSGPGMSFAAMDALIRLGAVSVKPVLQAVSKIERNKGSMAQLAADRAATLLTRLVDPAASGDFHSALGSSYDAYPQIQNAARIALQKLEIIAKLQSPDEAERESTIRVLSQNTSDEQVKQLESLLKGNTPRPVYEGILKVLGRIATDNAINVLIRVQMSLEPEYREPDIRDMARDELVALGSKALGLLKAFVKRYLTSRTLSQNALRKTRGSAADKEILTNELNDTTKQIERAAMVIRMTTDPKAEYILTTFLGAEYKEGPEIQAAARQALR